MQGTHWSLGVINNNLWAVAGEKEAVIAAGTESPGEILQPGAHSSCSINLGWDSNSPAGTPSFPGGSDTGSGHAVRPQLVLSENRATRFLCQDHLSQGER